MSLRNLLVLLALATLSMTATAVIAQDSAGLLRGPYLQSPTPDSMVVRWRTAGPTDSRVRYGTDPGAFEHEVLGGLVQCDPGMNSPPSCDHELRLEGLLPGTRYYYAVGTSQLDLSSGADHHFTTPPVPGTRQPVRIWTFGDSGWGAAEQAPGVRDAYLDFTAERGTDVWLLLGDNAYVAGSDPEYQVNFFDIYPSVLRQVPVWSTFGNHENFFAHSDDESGPYYDMFTFPRMGEAGGVASGTEAFHSFDYGNVHFINLNSQDVNRVPPSEMLTWLQADLASNEQEWTIVYFHHPVYSWGSHNSDTDDGTDSVTPDTPDDDYSIQQMREYFLPVLEAGGVDLVLTAHSHQYERSKLLNGHYGTSDTLSDAMVLDGGKGRADEDRPYRKTGDIFNDANSGTVYAVVGTGAESSYQAPLHPAMAVTVHAPGSLVIDIDGARLDGTFIDVDGLVRDHFTILRGPGFNFSPIARDDNVATPPATPITVPVLGNDSDPDEDLLMIVGLTQPAYGTASINGDGTITYIPPADLAAGSTFFSYTISDGQGHEASALVNVVITCPPLADGLFADQFEPDALPGWTTSNAQPPNPLSQEWTVIEYAGAHSPTHAWFSAANSDTSYKDDRLVSPPLDLSTGSRLTFWHRYDFEYEYDGGMLEISTDSGATWTDLDEHILQGGYNQTIYVPLDPPVMQLREERPVWTGSNGTQMTRVEVDLGVFAGSDRLIRWRLSADSIGGETGWYVDDVAVTNLVTGPGDCNLPPAAQDDAAATDYQTPVEIDVLANDTDPDGDALTISAVADPDHGTVSITPGQTLLYTPDEGFSGSEQFVYQVSDGEFTDTATVSVSVSGPPPAHTRVRGNARIEVAESLAHFAVHVSLNDATGQASGWLRYDSDSADDTNDIDVSGWASSITFPTQTRAYIEGSCWRSSGAPCTFEAYADDMAHPGAGADAVAISIYGAGGELLHSASGVIAQGQIKID